MSKETVVTTEIERARRDWMSEHLQSYLRSGGARGHIVDLRPIGGHAFTTTLLLRTKGRKSGQTRTAPLIYGSIGGEVVVVASKGGADVHPAWYHNIAAHPGNVQIEVEGRRIGVTAKQLHGAERAEAWRQIAVATPRFAQYQDKTDRQLPVVRLVPRSGLATAAAGRSIPALPRSSRASRSSSLAVASSQIRRGPWPGSQANRAPRCITPGYARPRP